MPRQAPTANALERAAELLCCPEDGEHMRATARELRCEACSARLVDEAGVLIERSEAPAMSVETGALKLMASPTVVSIYERWWRPALIRIISSLTYEREDEIVDRYSPSRPGLRVLDLCCGTARAARRWSQRGATVVGVDQSLPMLREARRLDPGERLTLVRADATRQIARPEAFDIVLCFASLHLIPYPRLVIDRAAAALQSDGVFFSWTLAETGLLASTRLRRFITEPVGLRVLPQGRLQSELASAGFEVVYAVTMGSIELAVARRR